MEIDHRIDGFSSLKSDGGKLRVAIVGLGKMGLVHAGILNVLPNVQLAAVCEKSNLIRRLSKKLFKGLEIVDDIEKLTGLNLDAVYVTTPIPSHFPVVSAILENRISKNLFVEKTLAQTHEEARELVNLVQTNQVMTMVGYLRRFYVTFSKARELIQQETIGNVESFKAYAFSSDFCGLEKRMKASNSRGGVLRDLGCHAIDLAFWLFRDIKVDCVERKIECQIEESLSFKVEGSKLAGQFDVSWCKEGYRMPEVGFTMLGPKGKLFVNDDQVRLNLANGKSSQWYRHDLNDNVPFWLGLPEYYREDLHFVQSAVGESKAEPDFHSAAKVDRIIDDVVSVGIEKE